MKLEGRHAKTHSGVVELFAFSAEACWDDPDGYRTLLCGPVIVEKGNASNSYAAANDIFNGISMDSIIEMASKSKCLLLAETPDAVKYIIRMMIYRGTQLPFNVLYMISNCVVHRIHRILALASRRDDNCGDTYAIDFTSKNTHKKKDIYQACAKLVDQELVVIHGDPPESVARHTSEILEHTIFRQHDITCSRAGADVIFSRKRGASELKNRRRLIETFLNGDVRSPVTVHYERQCCVNADGVFDRQICVQNVTAAYQSAGLLGDGAEGTPSKNRWGSCAAHDSEQVAGAMFHEMHPRSVREAFGSWSACAGLAADGDDDYRQFVRGKVWRTLKVTSEDDYASDKAIRSWCLEPMDHLWMQLQAMDEAGYAVLDVTFEPSNPITHARNQMKRILFEGPWLGPLRTVFYHFQDQKSDAEYDKMISLTRHLSVNVDAQVKQK